MKGANPRKRFKRVGFQRSPTFMATLARLTSSDHWRELAMAGDTSAAARLIERISEKLRADDALDEAERFYLLGALGESVRMPKRAGVALGLLRSKGRPKQLSSRTLEMGLEVEVLHSTGVPLEDGRHGDGAFTQVGKRLGASQSTVKRAWEIQKGLRDSMKRQDQEFLAGIR